MSKQKLQQVFETEILPHLGAVHKKDKYLKIIGQLAANTKINSGRGPRESQLTSELKPATHALNNLANKGFVEVTLPIGDGNLLVDPVNNVREIFNKRQLIERYFSNCRKHLENDENARRIAMHTLKFNSETELLDWLDNLEKQGNFDDYNNMVFKLLEKGIDLKSRSYGPLLWRNMAKFYNLSEKAKKLLED